MKNRSHQAVLNSIWNKAAKGRDRKRSWGRAMCLQSLRSSSDQPDVCLPLELQRFPGHSARMEERWLWSLPFADGSPQSLKVESNPLERNEWCLKMSRVLKPREWCFLKETSKQQLFKIWLVLRNAWNFPLKLIADSFDWKGNPFLIRSVEHRVEAHGGFARPEWGGMGRDSRGLG